MQLDPARPKMWSLQAIESTSLWSLHSRPLQLNIIFCVLGRPSFQDVVSSRHRAGKLGMGRTGDSLQLISPHEVGEEPLTERSPLSVENGVARG